MCLQNSFSRFTTELIIILIGIVTFISGLAIAIVVIYVIIKEEIYQKEFNDSEEKHFLQQHVFDMNLNKSCLDVIMGIILILCMLTVFFSVLLIIGIKRGFVLAYFGYGIMLTILLLISSLLELLQNYWVAAFITAMVIIIYINCLIMVYNTYEVMQKRIRFGSDGHSIMDDEEQILPLDVEQVLP